MSHDRSFLNNVVTQVIAAEPNGHWQEYAGGYDDWLQQRPEPLTEAPAATNPPATSKAPAAAPRARSRSSGLAPWESKELAELPEKIAQLEAQQSALAAQLSEPDIYADGPEAAQRINDQLAELDEQLMALFDRWESLEAKQGE